MWCGTYFWMWSWLSGKATCDQDFTIVIQAHQHRKEGIMNWLVKATRTGPIRPQMEGAMCQGVNKELVIVRRPGRTKQVTDSSHTPQWLWIVYGSLYVWWEGKGPSWLFHNGKYSCNKTAGLWIGRNLAKHIWYISSTSRAFPILFMRLTFQSPAPSGIRFMFRASWWISIQLLKT